MKKSQTSKEDPKKKSNAKDKPKEKQKKEQNVPNKENKKDSLDEDVEVYTREEIELLDKMHEFSNNKFVDDEIYEVMIKFHNDEEMIKNELKQMMKDFSKGDEYNWTEIGKSE